MSVYKKVELLANIAIVVVALLLGVVLVRRYLLPGAQTGGNLPDQVAAGTKLSLSGVDWAGNKQTLLLALSKGCHFCSESAPFYRRLAAERAGRSDLRLVAVLPQPVDEGRGYLDELGVSVDEVRQSALGSISVRGTPTLILVDGGGVVKQSWVGKLSVEAEAEVLSHLHAKRAGD